MFYLTFVRLKCHNGIDMISTFDCIQVCFDEFLVQTYRSILVLTEPCYLLMLLIAITELHY